DARTCARAVPTITSRQSAAASSMNTTCLVGPMSIVVPPMRTGHDGSFTSHDQSRLKQGSSMVRASVMCGMIRSAGPSGLRSPGSCSGASTPCAAGAAGAVWAIAGIAAAINSITRNVRSLI
ncbi:MAG: hypothetical protein B7Z72_14780, partial [Gemmatimonadetes bacterium 21-71-4]